MAENSFAAIYGCNDEAVTPPHSFYSGVINVGTTQGDDRVVELITKSQGSLYAYITSLLFRSQEVQDVLQETNMVLWQKRVEAPKDDEFMAWARRVAFYQVLAYRKKKGRDRHFFSESLLSKLAESAGEGLTVNETKVEALGDCLQKLPANSFQLLQRRYYSSQSVMEIAEQMQKSVSAISQSLYRIRKRLLDCVQREGARSIQ